ncbi:MAG TPA: YggT family protein [Acidimicrobiales bacterium]|nr:YggT family protein [Acidimicrobiales bacterium]
MLTIVHDALWLYFLVMFARVILSWFPITPGTSMAAISGFIYSVTEPVLGPVRKALPPLSVGSMGFDLSPILVLVAIQILVNLT